MKHILLMIAVVKAAKLGIWSMPDPTPPWDFRRGKGVAVVEIGQPNTAVFVSRTGAKYSQTIG